MRGGTVLWDAFMRERWDPVLQGSAGECRAGCIFSCPAARSKASRPDPEQSHATALCSRRVGGNTPTLRIAAMIQVKQDLLAALGETLSGQFPDARIEPVFEVPKDAALGDLACTVAMQLAKAQKKNPRELAQALIERLRTQPAFAQWVESMAVAGPGFINLRLKPAAKQRVVGEVLAGGERFGTAQPADARRLMVEFVSANPTGPLHVGHGRQAALGDAICNLFPGPGLGGAPRVLLQRRGRADRQPGGVHAGRA